MYVSELINDCVSVFTTSGRFVRTIGRPGSGPGVCNDGGMMAATQAQEN